MRTLDPLPPAREMARAAPIVKWVGGKRWLIPTIADGIHRRLLRTGGRYVEPFLGGAAIALHLGAKRAILGDVEPDLINFYAALQASPVGLAATLNGLLADCGTSEEAYYDVRSGIVEGCVTDLERAAQFLYLNKTCFNGLHRKNKAGQFNVPWGKRKSFGWPDADALERASRALRGAELVAGDFGRLVARSRKGDVLFVDPPYDTTFVAYAKGGFTSDDQARLADGMRKACARGAVFIATNADTPSVRRWYDWAFITPTRERRNVNSNGKGRGPVGCVLITNDVTLLSSGKGDA